MIYITGDTHSDLTRIEEFTKENKTTYDDVMVILGDVGINYYGILSETIAKSHYNKMNITLFCIQGNHEERPYNFSTYKTKIWNGGTVYFEEEFPNILFAKDGEIYNLNDKKCMVIGGAYSVDKHYRIVRAFINHIDLCPKTVTDNQLKRAIQFVNGDIKDKSGTIKKIIDKMYDALPERSCSWFKDEQPSDEIKNFVEEQLKNNKIDVVFSHTCPAKYTPTEMFLKKIDQSTVDHTTENWLDEIENNLDYSAWYCGHWHTDKIDNKIHFLFNSYTTL